MKKFTPVLICLFIELVSSTQISAQKNIDSAFINSFPYHESFESTIGWNQVTDDDGDWSRSNNGTPSENTCPSNGAEGSYYMFLAASKSNSTGQIAANATAIIESDYFDFSGQTNISFSFSNHMYGTNLGSLILQVSTNSVEWTSLWSFAGNNGNQWNKVDISLNDYANQSAVKLRFVGITGNGWSSDIAIDALSITTTPNNRIDKKVHRSHGNIKISNKKTLSTTLTCSLSTGNTEIRYYEKSNTIAYQVTRSNPTDTIYSYTIHKFTKQKMNHLRTELAFQN